MNLKKIIEFFEQRTSELEDESEEFVDEAFTYRRKRSAGN